MRSRIVVAIDFGTTYSGHAVHIRGVSGSDDQQSVSRFFDWPGVKGIHSGSRRYCKTITALYYEGDEEQGRYELQSWGWPALDDFNEACKLARKAHNNAGFIPFDQVAAEYNNGVTLFRLADPLLRSDPSRHMAQQASTSFMPSNSISSSAATRRFGCYVTQFKLDLVLPAAKRQQKLPGDLTTERLIVDYLRSLVEFIMQMLRLTHDNTLRREEVEWCITVPSIWGVSAKQLMTACAEKAGMGNMRTSPRLEMILEPEGGSVYCQMELRRGPKKQLRKGEKMMIVDIGGGTIDLVVQAKAEEEEESIAVDEVVGSYGQLGGGTFVDAAFLELIAEKIGKAGFEQTCRQDPGVRMRILGWWQLVKQSFAGGPDARSISLDLQECPVMCNRLHQAWKEEQARLFGPQAPLEDDCLWLEPDELRQRIFDPEVDKVLNQIDLQVVIKDDDEANNTP
ncbi:hypothetical protein GOP47_0005988 [Adiantum capillus-veneris]|uniref:Uncharacterized protein n=1 Tax=Adiantum capillus-veneris TaxID=13818 RepID=A0A9D4V2W7_ADICA|nr:hypothetical protein GOP47_0005988 [Adiantum capillus-veneris]